VLFFRPWNSSLALTLAIPTRVMNDVVLRRVTGNDIIFSVVATGVIAVVAIVVIGGFVRVFVLREIVQTHALPHGIHHYSNAEQHDLTDAGIATASSVGGIESA
jgi:hypothetical protein